jgi:hypothetical protein
MTAPFEISMTQAPARAGPFQAGLGTAGHVGASNMRPARAPAPGNRREQAEEAR